MVPVHSVHVKSQQYMYNQSVGLYSLYLQPWFNTQSQQAAATATETPQLR